MLMKLCDFLFGQFVTLSMAILNEMHSWNKWHLFLCTGHIDGYYNMLSWCQWRFRMMLLPFKLLTLNLFWIVYLNREAAMLEGMVSRSTHPLKVIIYWWRKALLGRKSIFWTLNGINGSMANPGRAPILRTKSVTKKQMNKCKVEI